MIVIAADERNNYQMVMDGVQAKMLVELLEKVVASPEFIPTVIAASIKVNEDGFETVGTDVIAAAVSVVSVLGFYTKRLRMKKASDDVVTPDPSQEDAPAVDDLGDVDGNKQEVPPKPMVN